MPPILPLRKDDGPACRVCGCTQTNACPVEVRVQLRAGVVTATVGCSWVDTGAADRPRWLCSGCAGTASDMAEVIERGMRVLLARPGSIKAGEQVVAMGKAAKRRLQAREDTTER